MMHDGAVVVHCGVVPTWWLPPTHLAGVALARNLCEIPKRQWVKRFIASPQPPDRLCCLPDELLLLVAQWLDVRELLELMLVNHQWRSLLADPYPWRQALLRRRRVRALTRADEHSLKSYLGLAVTDTIPWRRLAVAEYRTPSSWEEVLAACSQLCTLYGIAPGSALVTTTQSLAGHGRESESGSTAALSDIVEQLMHNTEASNSLCIVVLQRRDLIPTAYGLPSWYRRVRVFYLPDADPTSFYSIRLSSP